MSKNNAQLESVSFSSMFSESIRTLFSSKSKSALLNYDELRLVDTAQLKFIDTSHFKLVDTSQLRFLNLTALLFGIKYLAFLGVYMLVVGGFGVSYLSIKQEEKNHQLALERDNQYRIAMLNKRYENIKATNNNVVAYVPEDKIVVKKTEPKVLGVSDSRVEKVSAVEKVEAKPVSIVITKSKESLPSCSFNVENEVYASGSSLKLSQSAVNVCVSHNGDSVDWYVRGSNNTLNANSDCYDLETDFSGGTVVANVFDAQSNIVGSCSLNITK